MIYLLGVLVEPLVSVFLRFWGGLGRPLVVGQVEAIVEDAEHFFIHASSCNNFDIVCLLRLQLSDSQGTHLAHVLGFTVHLVLQEEDATRLFTGCVDPATLAHSEIGFELLALNEGAQRLRKLTRSHLVFVHQDGQGFLHRNL